MIIIGVLVNRRAPADTTMVSIYSAILTDNVGIERTVSSKTSVLKTSIAKTKSTSPKLKVSVSLSGVTRSSFPITKFLS